MEIPPTAVGGIFKLHQYRFSRRGDQALRWLKFFRFTTDKPASQENNPDEEIDPYNPFPEPVELPITDVIDLHTIRPRDVKLVVEEYLLQAFNAGFHVVRIVHGKGIGVQREIVRSVLARTNFVDRWTDAPPEAGGLGATIIYLKRETE